MKLYMNQKNKRRSYLKQQVKRMSRKMKSMGSP